MKTEQKPIKYSIGIDCSKDELVAAAVVMTADYRCIHKAGKTFKNTLGGYSLLDSWIRQKVSKDAPVGIAIEATGNYHENVTLFLHQKGHRVSVVLPNKSKRYMQSLGMRSKNDSIDAKGLAQMGAEQHLKQWIPFSKNIYELRSLTRYYEQITQTQTSLNNQLLSLKHNMYQMESIQTQLSELIDTIDRQRSDILRQIEQMIASDPVLSERVSKIIKIRGLGLLSLATIIAETNGFALFENTRQLTSYAGYDVVENQSGKRSGKTKISKMGNSHIRRIMYMPALGVVKYGEESFVRIYNRIYAKTNVKMKAYVAIQRKLLCLIYTLWKNNEEFVPGYDASGNAGVVDPLSVQQR